MQGLAVLFGRRQKLLLGLVLAGAALWAFLPAVDNGFVDYDDPDYVTANPHVREGLTWHSVQWDFFSSRAANWHPLTWLSHQLDWELFAGAAWGHHFTSILLHALNVVLVFVVLQRLTGSSWRSFLVALFFGLHPLRVESVAWISERKDVLCTTFFLLSIWAYARWARSAPALPRSDASPLPRSHAPTLQRSNAPTLWYALALVLFVLGLMCKQMLVTLPFVLLLLDFWPLGRWQKTGLGRLLIEKVPFLVAACVASIITLVVQRRGGAIIEGLPLPSRLENAAVSYVRYLGKLLYPVDLAFFYPPVAHWPVLIVLGSVLLLVAISALALIVRRKHPYVLIGWLWFVGTLVPVIGLVPAGEQSMADRYSYIPSIGVVWALVWAVADLLQRPLPTNVTAAISPPRPPSRPRPRSTEDAERLGEGEGGRGRGRERGGGGVRAELQAVGLVLATVLTFACALLTRRQVAYWRDDQTLFEHALRVTVNNYLAHNNLGTTWDKQGRYDDALAHFGEALRIKPDYAQGHCNLGVLLVEKNQLDEAIREFEKALQINPRYADAHNNMGIALEKKGFTDAALKEYRLAIDCRPEFPDAHYNLGVALMRQRKLDEAIEQFQTTLEQQPQSVDAHINLGFALQQKGQLESAIGHYQLAVVLRPDYPRAHFNLGVALYGKGLLEPAIREFQEALRLKPDYVEAQKNLEALLQIKRGK